MTIKEKIEKIVKVHKSITIATEEYLNDNLNKEEYYDEVDRLYTEAEKYLK